MLFLKVFDDYETEQELMSDSYSSPIPEKYRWRNWAADEEGITGDELLEFIESLFKEMKEMELDEHSPRLAFVVQSIFEDSYNYMKSGTLLRQVVNKLNEINFNKKDDRHQFNDLYEKILKDLQSAGNSGEYYTPRAVTQFMTQMVDPKLGETVLDPACGTGGFLVDTIEHMKEQASSVEDGKQIQENIKGVEKKPMPHMLCTTNLILHGIDVPKVRRDNTLNKPYNEYKGKDKVDVILTNPPFGGQEEDGIEKNFPAQFQTRETADLFLVLIMRLLKESGRCALVLPDGFLFGEGVKTRIKERLLKENNLHTIVRLPKGVFAPYTSINTNLLFFEKGGSTDDVWYFEHRYPEGYKSYSKTKPIRIEEFDVEKEWWNDREETDQAWKVSAKDIEKRNYNLDIKNPNSEENQSYDVEDLMQKRNTLNAEIEELSRTLLNQLKETLA
jgi:type I restriction enzyme M protein